MKEIYKPVILNYQHKSLAEGRWAQMPLAEQMLNIGSEVSRARIHQTLRGPLRLLPR